MIEMNQNQQELAGNAPVPEDRSDKFLTEKPIPLITIDDKGNLSLAPDAEILLKLIFEAHPDCSITSVSINGNYRTGKSLIMNRIFGAKSGFGIGDEMVAKTKGIWVLPKLVWRKGSNKPEILLAIDSEGLGDPNQNSNRCLNIYIALVLLSSTMIINQMNTVDADMLNKLLFASQTAEMIAPTLECKNKKECSQDEIAKIMPNIVFLYRDVHLLGNETDEKQRIIGFLKQGPNISFENRGDSLQQLQQKSFQHFAKVAELEKIFVKFLCRPVLEEDLLRQMDKIEIDDPRIQQKFKSQLESTIDLISEISKPKEFFMADNDKSCFNLDCSSFLPFLKRMIESINNKKVVIPEIFEQICKEKKEVSKKEVDKFLNDFQDEMIPLIPFKDAGEKNVKFNEKRAHMEAIIRDSIKVPQKIVDKAIEKAISKFESLKNDIILLDKTECDLKNKDLQSKLERRFQKIEAISPNDLENILSIYEDESYGDKQIIKEDLRHTLSLIESAKMNEQLIKKQFEMEMANLTAQHEMEKVNLKSVIKIAENEKTHLNNTILNLEHEKSNIVLQLTDSKNAMASLENEKANLVQQNYKMGSQISILENDKNNFSTQISELKTQVTELKKIESNSYSQIAELKIENHRKISELSKIVENLQAANNHLQNEKNVANTQNTTLNSQITTLKAQITTLNAQNATLNAQITTLNNEKAHVAHICSHLYLCHQDDAHISGNTNLNGVLIAFNPYAMNPNAPMVIHRQNNFFWGGSHGCGFVSINFR